MDAQMIIGYWLAAPLVAFGIWIAWNDMRMEREINRHCEGESKGRVLKGDSDGEKKSQALGS